MIDLSKWDRVFESISDKHPDTDCGVFFCGPAVLATELKKMSNKYTSPMGCRFFFGKEVRQLPVPWRKHSVAKLIMDRTSKQASFW